MATNENPESDPTARERSARDAERYAAREQALASEISARLRKACAHLPEAEFRELVLSIARVTAKYDGADPHLPPRASRRADG